MFRLVNNWVNNYVHLMSRKRPYRMTERARQQEETRQKIVEATMHLHEELGPRATTISAIADRAGVQRLTVYRHFEDETALFAACTAHWLGLNPPPDPATWSSVADAGDRARAAIGAFYRYYAATWRMWTVSYRDLGEVPALRGPMAQFQAHIAVVADDLTGRFAVTGDRQRFVAATTRHILAFPTWASLNDLGLSEEDKVGLALNWIAGTGSS